MTTELEQLRKWEEQTKCYMKAFKEIEKLKKLLATPNKSKEGTE